MKQWNWKKILSTAIVFAAAFSLGRMAAVVNTGSESPALDALAKIPSDVSAKMSAETSVETAADGNWGLSFPEEGQPPTANASMEELEKIGRAHV